MNTWTKVSITLPPLYTPVLVTDGKWALVGLREKNYSRKDGWEWVPCGVDGPEWEVGWLQFEDGDWDRLVQNNGDFSSVEFEMTVDAPVDRFATFWHDTRPRRGTLPPDGLALRAPLRFMM